MKKLIYLLVFIFVLLTSWFIFYLYIADLAFFSGSSKIEATTNPNQTLFTEEKSKTEKKIKKEEIENKIEKLRKRFEFKGLISLWDSYSWDGDYLLALKKYLEVYKENPLDESIIKKIADTYFFMWKYRLAYKNYSKIKNYNNLNKDRAILSLLYHKEISIENFDYIFKEIESFDLWEQKLFYYKTILSCLKDFHVCKKTFQDYIYWNEEGKELIEELQDIKNAIDNYRNFKVDQVYYKNALLVWSFFQNELYPISIHLWKNILQEKHDYKPILQIIWKSYFELWEYKLAKKYLSSYYELQYDDLDTVYLLWVISLKLKDYIISSVLLNKALDQWHDQVLNIRRNLVFNYFQLWETEKMLEELKLIIESIEKTTVLDYRLAIYHHIINDKFDLAEDFAIKWIEIYPLEVYFYAYLWWIYIEKWDLSLATENIDKWLELDNRNPMLLYYKWILEMKKWDSWDPFIYFKRVTIEDKSWDFWNLARKKLKEIKNDIK